ncbi:hypothetical protein AREALGSMS7_04239 [Arenibacter algicola]|uniref:Uncharacterized protein n=1 Tax=Arenibacter algicola TaxID=616991 RepID=A0A221V3D5_9FLAO|nr:hypothetical protein AREALGSMS7_04239 [Arenibacter algicola]
MCVVMRKVEFMVITIQFYLMYMQLTFFFTDKGMVLKNGMF